MTEAEILEKLLLDSALNLQPPRIRQSLLERDDFLSRWKIRTSTQVTLGQSGPSLSREKLYDAIRKALGQLGSEVVLSDSDGNECKIVVRSSDVELRFVLIDGDRTYNLSDHTALSSDAQTRLAWLERTAASTNYPEENAATWRTRLQRDPLDDDEFVRLMEDLLLSPAAMHRSIVEGLKSGQADRRTLVPSDGDYYARLVGRSAPHQSAVEYIENTLKPHFAQLAAWRPMEGLRLQLAACLNGTGSACVNASRVIPGATEDFLRWLEERADPLSQVAALELLIRSLDEHPEMEPVIARLVASVLNDEHDEGSGRLALFSALCVLTGGEMARTKTAISTSPYWRREAIFSHAALLTQDVLEAGLHIDSLRKWAKSQGIGHIFFLMGLIDLRREPRWPPDFVGASQLRYEFLGRIYHVANENSAKIVSADLRRLLLEPEGGLMAALKFPFPLLPGPLEGELIPPRELPPSVIDDIRASLSGEALDALSFAGLVNTALLYGGSPELSKLAADALRRVRYSIEGTGDEGTLFGLVGGLAIVAGVTRSTELANELRVLTRALRRRKRLVAAPEDEMRIALIAAAAHADQDQWAKFAGQWIEEISFEVSEKPLASRLLAKLRRLVELEPTFAAPFAIADAALLSYLDWA